jgi:hypothetical protein
MKKRGNKDANEGKKERKIEIYKYCPAIRILDLYSKLPMINSRPGDWEPVP